MEFLEGETRPFYFFSSKATRFYSDPSIEEEALLIFGSESEGLPEKFHLRCPERFLILPMQQESRAV